MGMIRRMMGRERRDAAMATPDPFIAEVRGASGALGAFVDPTRAGGQSVAYAAIKTIAENLSAVPLNFYERADDGGRVRATDHPLYDVLHARASGGMTAFAAREFLLVSVLTHGNGYARIDWNGRGQVVGLRVLDPRMVRAERLASGRLRYRVTEPRGGTVTLLEEEVLHLRHRLGPDGIMGQGPITIAREAFGLALVQGEQAEKQARRAFRPEGVMSYPNPIAGQNKEAALASIVARADAVNGTGGVLVLDGGAEWKPMALSSKDAEFLTSRKMSDLAIARLFSVPPTAVGITDNATYSNVDGESRALMMRCLAPMARRIEQALNVALLPELARRRLFIEHDLAGLLRGDLKARYDAYRIGREAGFLSANEIRAWENLPKIEGGDEFLSPLNMAVAGQREPEGAS